MTRCPDCGGEYTGGQCTDCGLTPLAAEIVRRRRLYRRTAWFLLGAIAFVPVSQWYPPLELDGVLIFIGVVFFLALALAVVVDRRARSGRDVETLKRIYYGFIPVPWLLAAMLFINGKFDSPSFTQHNATVIGRFSMPGFLHHQRLIVISWREGRHFERLAVNRVDFDRFQQGDSITVQVRSGAVGIPWLYAVYRR